MRPSALRRWSVDYGKCPNMYASEDCKLDGSFSSLAGFCGEPVPLSSEFRWAALESPTQADGVHVGVSGLAELDMFVESNMVSAGECFTSELTLWARPRPLLQRA